MTGPQVFIAILTRTEGRAYQIQEHPTRKAATRAAYEWLHAETSTHALTGAAERQRRYARRCAERGEYQNALHHLRAALRGVQAPTARVQRGRHT